MGSILNADNKINIEIAEKIAKGNKEYYANSKLIKSKLLKKNTKMKICTCKTMIIPVVTYSSETWTSTAKDKNNLHIFERQILTLRSLTLYIYGAPILDVSRSHTTTQHSR